MLNIMLVDDERLVRTGLKLGIDWNRADMTVVAEAESVSQALEKLKTCQDIDLVFTDIVMPGHTGLDLIRALNEQRPGLPVVIMTYHNDFTYVQEALRLGAIDYIHKSEIEQESFYETLTRISETVHRRREISDTRLIPESYNQALMVINMSDYTPPASIKCECRPLGHDNHLLLFETPTDEGMRIHIENHLCDGAFLLFFSDITQIRLPDVLYAGEFFINRDYFYRALPNLRIYEPESPHITPPAPDPKTFRWIEEQLYSLDWLNNDALYLKILSTIQRLRLSPNTLANLFFGVHLKWRHLLKSDCPDTAFQRCNFWYQWIDWIANLRRTLAVQSGCAHRSADILSAIQRVMLFLDSHFAENISVSQAAELASLSESYFAKCFREITRQSFHNYLRNLRLHYACKLLISSHLSVARIAELSGFSDPFHFTKLFKSQYGTTPGNYRLSHSDSQDETP